MTKKRFEDYLVSIGGLVNAYYPDKPFITHNLCECEDGWLQLIHDLIEELLKEEWDKHIYHIKEKFGALRFYTGSLTESQHDLVEKYCNLSTETCEICGEKGTLDWDRNWVRTLCKEHK